MFVVLTIAAMSIVYARTARVEAIASANMAAQAQADYIARGAVQYVMGVLADLQGEILRPEDIEVEAVPFAGGYFWLITPDWDQREGGLKFGLIDESSKLNLNTATYDMLIKLPNMTAEFAASIVDWRDSDSDITPSGAENDYYMTLRPAYYCKDAPFETLEELLLVRGATFELVYGEDANRNNLLDDNENDGDLSLPPDNRNNQLDYGLFDLATVYTMAPTTNPDGEPLVNVNLGDTTRLRELLEARLASGNIERIIAEIQTNRPYRNLMDLYIRAQLTPEEFNAIWDGLTAFDEEEAPRMGLINVNTAPEQVLACLPDLSEADAATMVAERRTADTENGGFAWVARALTQEKAIRIGDYITGRTYQYTADVVAVSANGRSFKRLRAVIDFSSSPPRIRHMTDLTALGWPLDPEILEMLRRGEELPRPQTLMEF